MYSKVFFFIIFLSFGSLVQASEYEEALSMCQAYSGRDISSELPEGQFSYKTTIQKTKAYQVASKSIKNFSHGSAIGFKNIYQGAKTAYTLEGFGLTPETKNLLDSPGYYRALKECFGEFNDNRYEWDSFTLMIILSDATGQAVVYVGNTVATMTIVGKGLKLLKAGFSLLSKSPMLAARPEVVANVYDGAKALTITYAAKTTYESVKDAGKLVSDEKIPELKEQNDEVLQMLAEIIQLEKKKPKNIRDEKRIVSLTNLYYERKKKHEANMQELRALSVAH